MTPRGWLLIFIIAACPFGAWAEEPQPMPSAPSPAKPCDPTATPCWTIEKLVIGLRAWTPGEDPRDLAGGRAQIEARYHHWRVQARIDGTATAGSYRQGDISTVRDVEAHAAGVLDLLRLPSDVTVGAMAGIGGAITLPEGGLRASIPRSVTAVLGLAGSWPGGRIHVGIGAVHPFARGLGVVAIWQIPLGDRTANIGRLAYGRQTIAEAQGVPAHSEAVLLVWTGVSVRL